jgi:hypothetical protein
MTGERYSPKATPALVAIAMSAFREQEVRDWLVAGTGKANQFAGAKSLHVEQAAIRGHTRGPFFTNYWWGAKRLAPCLAPGSTACEVDAMLFLEAATGRRLAIHIEFKRENEALTVEQAEAYPARAAYFAERAHCPPQIPVHDEWMTLLFCAEKDRKNPAAAIFDRAISHAEAAQVIADYPQLGNHHV